MLAFLGFVLIHPLVGWTEAMPLSEAKTGDATARCHNDLVIKDTVYSYSIISLLWSVTR